MGAKYDQLDLDERIEMSRLYEAGTSRREIGRIIGRSASTVGRELRRNTLPRGGYKPASADRIALSRRRRLSRIERLSPLRSYVCDRLAMGWSPEQIAGRLEQQGSGHSISHESIYRFIYRPRLRREKLHRFLPRAKATRGRRYFKQPETRSQAARPSMNGLELLKPESNSVIGKAISCSSGRSAATCSPSVRGRPASRSPPRCRANRPRPPMTPFGRSSAHCRNPPADRSPSTTAANSPSIKTSTPSWRRKPTSATPIPLGSAAPPVRFTPLASEVLRRAHALAHPRDRRYPRAQRAIRNALENKRKNRMDGTKHPVRGVDYPRTFQEMDEWFRSDARCREYIRRLCWPDGFACSHCDMVGEPWTMSDGLLRCRSCRGRTSLTAGTVFQDTRKPLRMW